MTYQMHSDTIVFSLADVLSIDVSRHIVLSSRGSYEETVYEPGPLTVMEILAEVAIGKISKELGAIRPGTITASVSSEEDCYLVHVTWLQKEEGSK